MSSPPFSSSAYCSPFLNWREEQPGSESERAVLFRSLVATVKFQPALDSSLEAKAVKVLESVVQPNRESADGFLISIASTPDNSSTYFVQCFGVLISSPNKVIKTAAMKMLGTLFENSSATSLSFAEAVDIHTDLLSSINHCVWLSTPYPLSQLQIEGHDDQQAVHETGMNLPEACPTLVQEFKNIATEDIESVRCFAENVTELLMLPLRMYMCITTTRILFNGTMKWALLTALLTLPLPTLLASGSGSVSWKARDKIQTSITKEINNLETNIKTIKINAWEEAVHKRILDLYDKLSSLDNSEETSSHLEDFICYIQNGLIVTSLFIENSIKGIPLNALSVQPTIASINRLTSDLMSILSTVKTLKHDFSTVFRFEAYLNAAEMKNTHEIDGRQYVLLGDDWRTMSPAEKKKTVQEYGDDIAVDLQECILGYRLKKGESGQQDQSSSNPSETSNLTDPDDDEQTFDT
ncbi:hypothetical protein BLNAU_1081 [Blattamonas nauphoetae]|uniref:Uncharacterized protein n=1 Tax=Blattamonas nauphoetae TaxID=2049346 RepID=A0ABQ9YJR2_9EUKA|nr:hypothetical protein BLNAU_1081 [Blattamonas nauphoetae]